MRRMRGFSLLELLLVLIILTIVMGVVFGHLRSVQRRSVAEQGGVEATQDARGGMDLLIRDIQGSGYPSRYQLGVNNANYIANTYALGVLYVDATHLALDGDFNNSGTVTVVKYYLGPDPTYPNVPAGNCPCALFRVAPTNQKLPATPTSNEIGGWTGGDVIIGNILNSGGTMPLFGSTTLTNGGVVGDDGQYAAYKVPPVFQGVDASGNAIAAYVYDSTSTLTANQVRAVRVQLNVRGPNPAENGMKPVVSQTASVKVMNRQ